VVRLKLTSRILCITVLSIRHVFEIKNVTEVMNLKSSGGSLHTYKLDETIRQTDFSNEVN